MLCDLFKKMFPPFGLLMSFDIRLPVPSLFSRMVWRNENVAIFSMLPNTYGSYECSSWVLLGGMLFLLHVFLLIVCPLVSCMEIFHFSASVLVDLSFTSLLRYLVVFVLCMLSLLVLKNCLIRSVNCIILGYARTQIGHQCSDFVSWRSLISAVVTFWVYLLLFQWHPFLWGLFRFYALAHPLAFLPSDPVFKTAARPLLVYSHCYHLTSTSLDGSARPPPLLAAPDSYPPSISGNDLPVALRRGKRSCTAHPLA